MGIYVDFEMKNCGFISTVECVLFYNGDAFSSGTDLIGRNVYCLASEATSCFVVYEELSLLPVENPKENIRQFL